MVQEWLCHWGLLTIAFCLIRKLAQVLQNITILLQIVVNYKNRHLRHKMTLLFGLTCFEEHAFERHFMILEILE